MWCHSTDVGGGGVLRQLNWWNVDHYFAGGQLMHSAVHKTVTSSADTVLGPIFIQHFLRTDTDLIRKPISVKWGVHGLGGGVLPSFLPSFRSDLGHGCVVHPFL